MSTSSVVSNESDCSNSTNTTNPSNWNQTGCFDKCPGCVVQYDFLKRGGVSKVPLILSCKHTVCEDCIHRLCYTNAATCPVCGARIEVSRTQANNLTEIFTPHFSIIGYLMWAKSSQARKQMEWVPTGLTLRTKQVAASGGPVESNTEVDSGSEAGSIDSYFENSFTSFEFMTCPGHSDQFVNVHCENCNERVCCYCFLESHAGHKPISLYKLTDEEESELCKLKADVRMLLKQLQESRKQVRKFKTFDLSHVEDNIKKCFSDLHAKLHLIERNMRKKLLSFNSGELDLEDVELQLRSGIFRVMQVLNLLSAPKSNHINMRGIYEEILNLKTIPCRLVSDQDSLEPVEFVCDDYFDNIEEHFSIMKRPLIELNLVAIDDWSFVEEEEVELAALSNPDLEISITKESQFEAPLARSKEFLVPLGRPNEVLAPLARPRTETPLNEGGKVRSSVTHLNDLNSFYIQKYSSQVALKTMNSTIGKRVKKKLTSEGIRNGRIYGVLYETKNAAHWRRGKLIDVTCEGPSDYLYKIFFLDYGHTQSVTIDKLKEIDINFVKRPPYAFECKLINANDINFDTNCRGHLCQIISQKELYYIPYLKPRNGEIHEIDLVVRSSDGNFRSVRDILLRTAPEPDIGVRPLKLFRNSKKFTVGQSEEVVVTYLNDPYSICIQLTKNVESVENLKKNMKDFYENQKNTSCVPVEGTDVAVKYDHQLQGSWHRGRILSVNNVTSEVDLYFVDWGGEASVNWNQIRLLKEDFTKVECQGIIVKLADIQKTNEGTAWSQEVIHFLNNKLVNTKQFKMVVSCTDPLEVALFEITPSTDICLNSLLVEEQHACPTGIISETLYWPNQSAPEDNDDDNFSFQLIKKAEEVIMESDDVHLNSGLKQQVVIMHFETPELIYFTFSKHKETEEDMQKELLIHYSTKRKTKKIWKRSENCIVHDSSKNNYFRGVIESEDSSDTYVVYLYDLAQHLKVHKRSIFVYDRYFRRWPCFVYKCRLANVKPAGDKGEWSKMAVEVLQKIFTKYKTIYVKKVEKDHSQNKLGVIMWYSLITPGKALEPSKMSFISINLSLVESGVALVTVPTVNPIETLERISPVDRDNCINVNGNLLDSDNSKVDWNDLICEDERPMCEDEHLTSVKSWPKPFPLEETQFNAVLVCIDSEGCFLIRSEEMQSLFTDMQENLNSTLKSKRIQEFEWKADEMCMIMYEDEWYRGTIIKVLSKEEVSVEMIDFGSVHVANKAEVTKFIMYPDLPPFVNKVQLYDVYGQWTENDVDELLKIVSNKIKIIIKGSLNCEMPFAEIFLENGLSINELITQKCPHLIRYENKVALGNVYDLENADAKRSPEKPQSNKLNYTYVALPKSRLRKSEMFVISAMKWDTVYSAVLNISNSDAHAISEEFLNLSSDIQANAEDQSILENVEINEPCICLHPQKSLWSRAIIQNVDSLDCGCVLAFFVDYGTVDMVATKKLRIMKPEWFNLPVANRIAVINIKLIQDSRAESVLMQMNNLRGKSVLVDIVSEDPLKVHLYEENNLCYQNFVDGGIITAL